MRKLQIPDIGAAARLFVLLIASTFIIELLIMFLLDYLRVPSRFDNFLDSILLSIAIYPILYRFVFRKMITELEERKRLDEKLTRLNEGLEAKIEARTSDLFNINKKLLGEISERKQTEGELRISHDIHGAINSLLRLSLEDIALETVLEYTLDLVISIPWFAFESKGAIFMAEEATETLVLKAQKGLSEFVRTACARRPFGSCLCGLAASEKKIQFADHVNDRHQIHCESVSPHGHLCVPIIFADKVLGVITIYIKEGHARDQKEEEFLTIVANTLAGIIMRKQSEENLKKAYTSLQETQDQLIQAEKLNAIGQLASGVAHEVRNPLGIILQGVEYLEKAMLSKEKVAPEAIVMIKDNIKRADNIIALLLDFSKAARLDLKTEDINSVLESSLDLIKTKFKFVNIDIIRELKRGIPRILIDRNKMEQVFINVFLNAMQATPEGGKIIVRSYDKKLEEARNGVGRRKEDYFRLGENAVIVEIEDTGIGIPEENLKRVFDPFFTTKGPKGGAGLGLSVSRNIILMHGGLMDVTSKIGKGTRVTIVLHEAKG